MRRTAAGIVCVVLAASCTSGRGPNDASPAATTPPPTTRAGYTWQADSGLPTPRTEVAVAVSETQVFVAGGFTADGRASGALEMFDSSEGEWSVGSFPPLPEPLHHTAMVSYRGQLYVFGGYRADGSASSAVWTLIPYIVPVTGTPGPGAWQRRPDMPTARGAHAAVLIDGVVHIVGGASRFGGGTAKLVAAHDAYDIKRRAWSTLPPFPDPRDHLAAAAIGKDLYVVGGRKLSAARNSGRLDIFDTAARTWRRGPDMPTPRGGIAAAVMDGKLFVVGGEEPAGTFEETEIYDPHVRTWTAGPPMPTPRHGLGAGVVYGSIAAVGGGPEPGLSVSDAIEFLLPAGR